jgi:hypothetical protein
MGRVNQYWVEERRVVAHLADSIKFRRREVNFVRYFTMAGRFAAGSICLRITVRPKSEPAMLARSAAACVTIAPTCAGKPSSAYQPHPGREIPG